jgi:hypothetical protein
MVVPVAEAAIDSDPDDELDPATQALLTVGTKTAEIPVAISYRIIELFSAGLYSSPHKALEELVTNGYDAGADRVDLVMPPDIRELRALIWVIDNGASMDLDGLVQLWRIAASNKRNSDHSSPRPPIGRFGIGKLATYVLASHLTYLCKKDGVCRAVSMDFDSIPHDDISPATEMHLAVRQLDATDVAQLLEPMRSLDGGVTVINSLLGADGPQSWTVAVMGKLKPIARQIKLGRLRWVLETALPMSPDFDVTLNGNRIVPTPEQRKPLTTWMVGKADEVAKSLKLTTGRDGDIPYVEIPGLGRVTGEAKVYSDLLTRGKASEMGRSHGIFVRVRGRVVNLTDPLFGMDALSHGPFGRFHMIVNADGLDRLLRSSRESVLEAPEVDTLRSYLKAKFNEARAFLAQREERRVVDTTERVGRTAGSLSRRPLLSAVTKLVAGQIEPLAMIEVPALGQDEAEQLIERMAADLEAGESLIAKVEFQPLGVEHYLARYDPLTRVVQANILHPFLANYVGSISSTEPLELIAVAELLTEAYLLDEQLPSATVRDIVDRRDRFLRELVLGSKRLAAPVIAQTLLNSVNDPKGLEDAVALALQSLGFEVSPIGGSGKPDGVAYARLGVRQPSGESNDYTLTYDAKSTSTLDGRVSAKDVHASGLARHRGMYGADFTMVVGPAFQGGADPEGALCQECVASKITPITAVDLALLVQLCAARQIGFAKLRELFEFRTTLTVHDWIIGLKTIESRRLPIAPVLSAISRLMRESHFDPVTWGALQLELRRNEDLDVSMQQLKDWMRSVNNFAPGYLDMTDDMIALETSVDRIVEVVQQNGIMMPRHLVEDTFLASILPAGS